MIDRDQIQACLDRVRGFWAPNYFGTVPDDWEAVAEALPVPTVDQVLAVVEQCAGENEIDTIEMAIVLAAGALLPRGYDGVALVARMEAASID